MKFSSLLLGGLAALSLSFISCAGPRTYQAPSVAATRASVTKAQSSVSKAQTHVVAAQKHAEAAKANVAKIVEDKNLTPELHELAINAKAEIDYLTKELLDTQEALASAQTALSDSQANVAVLQKDIKKQTETLNKTAADLARTTKAYHKMKFWICLEAAAVVLMLLWQFRALLVFIPPPYNLVALGVGPIAVFGFLWLLL